MRVQLSASKSLISSAEHPERDACLLGLSISFIKSLVAVYTVSNATLTCAPLVFVLAAQASNHQQHTEKRCLFDGAGQVHL